MKATLKRHIPLAAIALCAVAWGCFFQFGYPYHFFFHEQNQLFLWSQDYLASYFSHVGCIAALTGDFLTQFWYYLYVGAITIGFCLLLIGLLLYRGLCNLHVSRLVAVLLAIVVMSFVAVCHFSTSYHLSSTISCMAWCLLLWLISLCKKKWPMRLALTVLGVLLCYPLFGLPKVKHLQGPDFILEKDFAVDCEYYFGNHQRVISLVEGSDAWSVQMLFFYNLAQAQRGQLPDHLLKFTPTDLGTFYQIGPDIPMLTIRNMNELYWALGDMTFTERAAMMTNVFSTNNRNVRMMRRLAECNIVSGDSLAAEKYLRILDRTFVYRPWAQRMRQHGREIYKEKIRMVNHHDTITISDNAHFLMMQLLDACPDNLIALDYLLCSDLLLKDITNFKRDYDRYCTANNRPRLKPLYQEALCIWLAGTKAPEEQWRQYIRQSDVMQRFADYNNHRGDSRYRGTYWYYFDKIKAPEI